MAYFRGDNLKARVRNEGLQELYDILEGVAKGTDVWTDPATFKFDNPGQDIEPMRTLLYSILTELAIKQDFFVKTVAGNELVLDKRRSSKHAITWTIAGRTTEAQAGAGYCAPAGPIEVMGPEFDLDSPEFAGDAPTIVDSDVPQFDPTDLDDPNPTVHAFLTQVSEMGKASPLYKEYAKRLSALESATSADRPFCEQKVAEVVTQMEKAIRAAGYMVAPLSEDED